MHYKFITIPDAEFSPPMMRSQSVLWWSAEIKAVHVLYLVSTPSGLDLRESVEIHSLSKKALRRIAMVEMRQAQGFLADEAGVRPRASWSSSHRLFFSLCLDLNSARFLTIALSKTALRLTKNK